MEYFYELFERLPRCGPGTNECTRKAYGAIPHIPENPYVLDIGCGPGVQTLELARASRGTIVALDNHQPFLDTLMESAHKEGLADRIMPRNESMLDMGFDENTFDIIWSEGALYFMGFGNGLRRCRQLLKKTGVLGVTEAVFLRPDPPAPLLQFWEEEYPDIDTVDGKVALIEQEGFHVLTQFTLPKSAWLESFYSPMEAVLDHLRDKYRGNRIAQSVFESMQKEIDLYKQYSDYYGYEFFVAQKVS